MILWVMIYSILSNGVVWWMLLHWLHVYMWWWWIDANVGRFWQLLLGWSCRLYANMVIIFIFCQSPWPFVPTYSKVQEGYFEPKCGQLSCQWSTEVTCCWSWNYKSYWESQGPSRCCNKENLYSRSKQAYCEKGH